MKRLFLLALVCLQALAVSADYLRGRVIDASNEEALPDVEVICKCSGDNWWFSQKATTDSLGCFFFDYGQHANETMRLEIRFEYFGYHTKKKNIMLMAGRDTVNIGDIRLQPFEGLLDEVTVKGRVRRFTVKGDTIVFNPEAFHLEEGERLGELIKRLPGVTVQDGKLFWNNRPLRMQMNGENTLSADLLAELPVEAVEKIETYEKKTELTERTGHDDGEGEQVLNIKIKESFLDKLYGNVQAKGLTNLGYQGGSQLMRLSTDNPLMIAAKAGDHIPNYTTGFGFDYEMGGWSRGESRQQIGALGYQHLWDSPYKDAKHRNNWDVTLNPNHLDQSQSSWERREVFGAEGGTPTYISEDSERDTHSFKVPLNASWFANVGQKTTISGNASLTFNRTSKDSHSTQSTYDPSTGSGQVPFEGTPVNTNDSRSTNNGDSYTLNFYQGLTRYYDQGSLWAQLRANHTSSQNDFITTSDYTYRDKSIPSNHEVQNGESRAHNSNVQGRFGYNNWLTKALLLKVQYDLNYTNNFYKAERMRGDGITQIIDLANSQRHRYEELHNSLQLGVTENVGQWNLTQNIVFHNYSEWLDYTRGTALDTLARRNTLLPNIDLKAKWKVTKASSLEAYLGWYKTKPSIYSTLGYVDTTNPLYIEMGNPNLRNGQSLGANLAYYITIPRGEQNLSVKISANKNYSPIVTLYRYNTTTGAYIVTSENGRGGHDESLDINYDRSLVGHFRMNASTSFSNYIAYTLPTRIDDAPASDAMAQHKLGWIFQPSVSYDDEHWNAKFSANTYYCRTTYSDASYQNSATWQYRADLNIKYKIEHWNFYVRPVLLGSRGELTSELNHPRLEANAGIEWKFLKNRAKLTLEANDIFNQYKYYSSYVNTQERTEYGSPTVHHYVSLGFTYRFDAKGKK